MDPVIGGMIIGTAIREYQIRSKTNQAARIAQKAATRIAEAEVRLEQHQKETEQSLENLCIRVTGIAEILDGQFASVFKPFEHTDGSILRDLFGVESAANLAYIQRVSAKTQIMQLPAQKKVSGKAAAVPLLFSNRMRDANRQLDTARTQSQTATLIETHSNTICDILDMQKEQYLRVYQVLGALNVALIVSNKKAAESLSGIQWLLDEQGHIPSDLSSAELKSNLGTANMDQVASCINVAKVILSILEEPIFSENAELTERAQKMLNEGETALQKIQLIEQKRR